MRPALLVCLCLVACARSSAAPEVSPPDAHPPDARADVAPSRCAIPPGNTTLREAVAAAGWTCERYPFALQAPRDAIETADGRVFVTEMSAGRVVELRADGVRTLAAGLTTPIGLRALNDRTLLVAEEDAHRLSRIDRVTGARSTVADGLAQVTYVTVGPDGAAYVSSFTALDAPTATVKRVSLDGVVREVFTGLNVPEGLFFDALARLHVANWGAPSRLLRFQGATGDARDAAVRATGFERLYGAAPATDGVVVGDTATGTVTLLRDDGTRETLLRDVAVPAGIFRTARGDLLVTELGRGDFRGLGSVIRLRAR